MRTYLVTAYTPAGRVSFTALAAHPVEAMGYAYDVYGPCSVTVRPA